MEPLERTLTGTRLRVRLVPRASRNEVAGLHGDCIRIRVTAAPVGGAANQELLGYLAKRLHLPRAAVHLESGETGRTKMIAITGLNPEQIRTGLGL